MALSRQEHAREKLESGFLGFSGLYGDRLYAFRNSAAHVGFPFLTAREQPQMLLHQPRFRDPEKAFCPPNLAEAAHLAPGLTPLYASIEDLAVDVETPEGAVVGIDSAALRDSLGKAEGAELTLLKSDRAMTDCRPVSLISVQTVAALGEEVGTILDRRRFRANIYVDLNGSAGFAEDALVGKKLRFGSKAMIAILERDPRCKMITLDPDHGHATPEILQTVAKAHQGRVGVYAAVLIEGTIHVGDEIALLN